VPAIAWVDAGQLEHVVTNLVMNAMQAMPNGGSLDVEVGRRHGIPPAGHEAKSGDCYYISVRDEGEGIPAENQKHIFDPFFSTRDVGQGSGLGLSIAFGIVQEHGGWIEVTSQPGMGSCFCIYLPANSVLQTQEGAATSSQEG
jgi:signal transduction histidine kinase